MLRFLILVVFVCRLGYAETWFSLSGREEPTNLDEQEIDYTKALDGSEMDIKISIPGLFFNNQTHEGYKFTEISIKNEGFTTVLGQAKIPVIRRLIKISDGANIKVIEQSGNFKKYDVRANFGSTKILPVQESQSKSSKEKLRFMFDKKYYARTGFDSLPVVKIGKVLKIKGEIYVILEIFPFRYNPSKNLLEIASDINVRLKVADGSFKEQGTYIQKGMLIIVGELFEESQTFHDYVDWKKKTGLKVKVISVSSIGKQDTLIRAFLLEEYKLWKNPKMDYLLIVGDVAHVPTHNGEAGGKRQATDNYYATLDTPNYLEDISTPDVAVGRIPVNTEEELSIVFEKIIKYEKGEFQTTEWIKKFAFIGTDDRSWFHVAEGTHNYVIENHTRNLNYQGIFPEKPMLGGDKLYAITHRANTQNVFDSINEGRIIVNFSGHGANTYWAGPKFGISEIQKLSHRDATPYVVSNACITGTFANNTDSFAEMWIKAPRGALAFYGASGNSYWHEDDVLEKAMWDHLFRDKIQTIGDINSYGLDRVRLHYNNVGKVPYYYEIYNLMGDPSTPLYTKTPEEIKFNSNPIFIGENNLSLYVFNSQGPVKDANVFLKNDQGTFSAFARTNEEGVATLDINSENLQPGFVQVVITASNHIYNESVIEVITPAGPYFIIEDFDLNVIESRVSSFDKFNVRLKLKNIGKDTGNPILSLQETSQGLKYVGKINGGCDNLILSANQAGFCQGSYTFYIDKAISDGRNLRVDMIAKSDGYEHNVHFSFPVKSSVFEITEIKFEEIIGNGNGNPDIGESLNLNLHVKNKGKATSKSDFAEIKFLDSCLLPIGSGVGSVEIPLGTLKVNKEMVLNVPVKVSQNCNNGFISKFIINLRSLKDQDFVYLSTELSQILGTKEVLAYEFKNKIDIPDFDPEGVRIPLNIEEDIIIEKIMVYLNITHTYIGDLEINIISPQGQSATLHKRNGGGAHNLIGWYGKELLPIENLNIFNRTRSKGAWVLHVKDLQQRDIGFLSEWKINIEGY